jgi:hypothetical protein
MVKAWQSEPTKRILYNRETGLYLADSGQWSPDEEDAKDFPSVFQALEFCCQNQLGDAQLIFKFDNGQVCIPLGDPAIQEPMAANLDQDWAIA